MDVFQAWFSAAEAAHYARVGRTKLYELIKTGALRPRKLGRRTLLSRAEIDALIESGSAPVAKGARP